MKPSLPEESYVSKSNETHPINLLVCHAEGVAGEVFNTACGERFTLLELVAQLEQIVGRKAEPEFAPSRPGEVKHSLAAIAKARQRLGYVPVVRFDEGIKYTVGHLKSATGMQD
jgi:UDP-glucose 4-epimerase